MGATLVAAEGQRENVRNEPVTVYAMQYRVRGINFGELTVGTKDKIKCAMQELISLANGLEDEDVSINLRAGSLIIDATADMHAGVTMALLPFVATPAATTINILHSLSRLQESKTHEKKSFFTKEMKDSKIFTPVVLIDIYE